MISKRNIFSSFTLIELLVSVGIIVFVIIISVGIYVYTLGSQQKNTSVVNLQQDAQYLMSMIAKDVRNNWLDYDYYNQITTPEDELALVDNLVSPQNYYAYRYDSENNAVKRCQKSGARCQEGDFATLTMTNVKVKKLDFYLEPNTNPFTYGINILTPPRVTIVIELGPKIERWGQRGLQIQGTVQPRGEEKK